MDTRDTLTTLLGAAALGLAVFLVGCDTDDLVEVPDPDVVSQPVFTDPGNLDNVLAGVRREWARAYGGEQNDEGGQIHQSGMFADELHHSGSFTTRQDMDARDIQLTNASNEESFFELQRARNHAELAAELFADSDRAGEEGHVEVMTLAGYSYILFAENYCSGVPFSVLPLSGESVFGEPETTEQILQRALDRFSTARGLSGATGDLVHLIDVGRGRALLDMDQPEAAADAVSSVPTTFLYRTPYDPAAQSTQNAVFQLVNEEKRWSATGNEGVNGHDYIFDEDDPRIPAADEAGEGFQAGVTHYQQFKYDGLGADIPLATGIEARLIEAEAALRAGERDAFFSIHEELRTAAGLPALEDTGQSQAELVEMHFAERADWLWLTAHRLGDLRRMVRQYGMSPGQVYPVGHTVQGTPYGMQLNMPVPFSEENNPSYDPMQCTPGMA